MQGARAPKGHVVASRMKSRCHRVPSSDSPSCAQLKTSKDLTRKARSNCPGRRCSHEDAPLRTSSGGSKLSLSLSRSAAQRLRAEEHGRHEAIKAEAIQG